MCLQLEKQQSVIRDFTRQVLAGYATGFYLYGPPGTGKTHLVRSVLEGSGYVYRSGHLTPIGLFDLIEQNPDKVIVLDDVGQVLNSEIAVQLLLSALTPGPIRIVSYGRSGEERLTPFRGGIILISNKDPKEKISAFWSRVNTFKYAPTNEQLTELMRSIYPLGCAERQVAEHVIGELGRLQRRFDLRVLTKAVQHYKFCVQEAPENEWQELVRASLAQPVTPAAPEDTVATFLQEQTVEATDTFVGHQELYTAYRDWCLRLQYPPVVKDTFSKTVNRKSAQRTVNGRRLWCYVGLRLK